MPKIGIIILSSGEPIKATSLKNYLLRLYNDPFIFSFPYFRGLTTKFLAGRKLKQSLIEYDKVSTSASYKTAVREFIRKFKSELRARKIEADVYHAARYTVPFMQKISKKVLDANYDFTIVTTVNPFYSKVLSGSYFREWERIHGKRSRNVNITEFYNQKNFIAAVSERVAMTLRDQNLEKTDTPFVLFTAESSSPIEAEYGDPYREQLQEACDLVMHNFPDYEHKLSFYKHLIMDKMLEPSVEQVLQNVKPVNVVVVPLGSPMLDFHTYYKLNYELKQYAKSVGVKGWFVSEGILESEKFSACMVGIVKGALKFAGM